MIRTLDQLYNEHVGNDEPITLTEFKKNGKAGKKTIVEYTNNDESLIERIYDFYIKNNRKLFDGYFHALGAVETSKLTYNAEHLRTLTETFNKTGVIDASLCKTYTRRLGENVFFADIYLSTEKAGKITPLQAIRNLKRGIVDTNFISPKNREIMDSGVYTDVRKFMNTAFGKASLFSPMAYQFALDRVLRAKKVLIPAGSWGSPVIAFANSDVVDEMHVIDVIPHVVDKSKEIFDELNHPFFGGHKKLQVHCCPSQHIDERFNFTETHNDFDAVFFSPPYYDVEQYEGGEQSWKEYPTYESWLAGYWKGTVEMCYRALKTGGTFSFVIVNYKRNGKEVDISGDMLKIVHEVFGESKENDYRRYGLRHSRQSGWNEGANIAEKMKEGLVEDVHVIKKIL